MQMRINHSTLQHVSISKLTIHWLNSQNVLNAGHLLFRTLTRYQKVGQVWEWLSQVVWWVNNVGNDLKLNNLKTKRPVQVVILSFDSNVIILKYEWWWWLNDREYTKISIGSKVLEWFIPQYANQNSSLISSAFDNECNNQR